MNGPRPTLASWERDVVLADGGSAHVRPLRPEDGGAIAALYDRTSEESRYLRFFSITRPSRAATQQSLEMGERHFGLVVEVGDDLVAVADYHRLLESTAEVAFTVQDDQQGRGLGTILLEHLASIALAHGITRFTARLLSRNDSMRRVFTDTGFPTRWSRPETGELEVVLDLGTSAAWEDAHGQREHHSEALSVARILAPRSIAVIGASRRANTIGRAVLANLLTGGFTGRVVAVNPRADRIAEVTAYPSVLAVPGPVDLAVVTVPADAVLDVVADCARKGVLGAVIISSGFAEFGAEGRERERQLVALARRSGLRLVGPNCFGILNTNPAVAMNATFAPVAPEPGRVGFASQSGGLGIALLEQARSFGIGVSTFVSVGNRADLSTNDLLQYWEEDPDTDVVMLYVESFGNPQKFARIARRVSRHKPVLALKSGRTPAGARGAASHTAALTSSDTVVGELFRQAGVVRVDTVEDLFGAAAMLAHQPLPDGRRVVVVSNGGGPGIVAADAGLGAGLEAPELTGTLQATLRSLTVPGAGVRNPVDLGAAADAATYENVLRALLASEEVDAVVVVYVAPFVSQPAEIERAIGAASKDADKPIVACFFESGQHPLTGVLAGDDASRRVPVFRFPEAAVRALGHATQYAEWTRRPQGSVAVSADLDRDRATRVVEEALRDYPEGLWLDLDVAHELLSCFGILVVEARRVGDVDEAAAAATELGFPVALKALGPELVHKSDVGGVRLHLASSEELRVAYRAMREQLGDRMRAAVVEPMVDSGVDTIAGITRDPTFGPLVLFGLGGVTAELLHDTTVRLLPLHDADVHEMVRSLRGSPLLFGYRGTPPVDVEALEDLLVRLGQLAEHVPEIVELDCNPVIASANGVIVVDVKVRVEPADPSAHLMLELD